MAARHDLARVCDYLRPSSRTATEQLEEANYQAKDDHSSRLLEHLFDRRHFGDVVFEHVFNAGLQGRR